MANWRRKNGREKHWKVLYFGIGNETMGCGGGMTPEFYADTYRRYQCFVPNPPGYRLSRVACGPNAENYNWTRVMMEKVVRVMWGLSLHYYPYEGGAFAKKGSATAFGEPQWMDTMRYALRMEDLIVNHTAIMDKYDPQKRVALVVDEWGTWYNAEPGASAALQQQVTLRDALVAGLTLNIINNHADRVRMANLAQMVNVLQALVLTKGEKMVLTPTYHVFEMYKGHQGAQLLRTDLNCRPVPVGDITIPSLNVSASRATNQALTVSICNLDPKTPVELQCVVSGAHVRNAAARVLTAAAMNSHNTFEAPRGVEPALLHTVETRNGEFVLTLPAKSVTVLTIQ
jgi:alpha-N-arabinofuranosidase